VERQEQGKRRKGELKRRGVTTKRVYFISRLLFITCTITVGHMTDASSLSHMTHDESFLGLHFPYDSL
jgi:hypothetical protein